ncbi:leucine-rich repeat and guanylate kinase domain-containing protein-like isoform X2 [Hypanus sabinus]|uniref:leucine-rich repeat and guanylate kinase domain-containing protein-like isoform X2 n=1 Tax=Hypanus sabinus TaxID=79690 RepID=UPI0028C39E49|nr:leucine-rich repeat and guanylate kinase domain-containing protein-like isoform X2 [Hypanus sabinus]
MEAPTVSESALLEGEAVEGVEVVWQLLEELIWECAQRVLEEALEEVVQAMLLELLDGCSRELVDEFHQELLDDAVSSTDTTSSDEGENLDDEEEFDGLLTEDIIVEGLSNLRRSATGMEQAYLHLSLPNYELSDISILCDYIHLQKLELPYNKITDLRCVSYMPYLIQLDASHNSLTSIAGLKLPKHIKLDRSSVVDSSPRQGWTHTQAPTDRAINTEVDFSYNQISDLKELSDYPFLSKLNLSNNQIQAIEGLQNCKSLTYLNMAENRLLEISGLDYLPIKFLFLQGNQFINVKGLANMKRLHKLDLSNNKIETLIGLEDHDLLETINLENNQISDLDEIMHLRNLQLLRKLNLLKNPIQGTPDYLLWVLFIVQKLTELDNKQVKTSDKVLAINKYNPPPEVVAANDHMTNIMYSFLQPQRIYDSTLPNLDIPYPMLVLVGVQASGKRELCHMVCQEFSEYFGFCIGHTSRRPSLDEKNGFDYYFVSDEEFEEMIQMGKFIQTMKFDGCYFGLSRDALENVASKGLACCTHMELEGVRSLKKTYLEPRYILLIPQDKKDHEKRLRIKGLYTESHINHVLSRVDDCINMNQTFPGYFDAVINSDELTDTYTQLSQLIKEYLSLNDPTSVNSTRAMEVEKWQMSGLTNSIPSNGSKQNWSSISWTIGFPTQSVDSSIRNYSSRIQARLSTERSTLEQNSIQQRQREAREVVMRRTQYRGTFLFKRARTSNDLKGYDVSKLSFHTSIRPNASDISQDLDLFSTSSSETTQISTEESTLSSAEVFTKRSNSVVMDTDSSIRDTSKILLKIKSRPITDLNTTPQGAGDTVHKREEIAKPEPTMELQPLSKSHLAPTIESPSYRLGFNIKPVLPEIPSGRTTAEIPFNSKETLCNLK